MSFLFSRPRTTQRLSMKAFALTKFADFNQISDAVLDEFRELASSRSQRVLEQSLNLTVDAEYSSRQVKVEAEVLLEALPALEFDSRDYDEPIGYGEPITTWFPDFNRVSQATNKKLYVQELTVCQCF